MKFFDKKLKVFFSVFAIMILLMFEMGTLSGFRFANSVKGEPTKNGLTVVVKTLEKSIGWNYIVVSIIIVVGLIAFAAFLGYKKNIWGLIAMEVASVVPIIGMFVSYNFLYGWGTAHLCPAMYLFGIAQAGKGVQIAFLAALMVVYAILWFVSYKARLKWEAENLY